MIKTIKKPKTDDCHYVHYVKNHIYVIETIFISASQENVSWFQSMTIKNMFLLNINDIQITVSNTICVIKKAVRGERSSDGAVVMTAERVKRQQYFNTAG